MNQFDNQRKSYPHVPKQSYERQPMHYIQISDDGSGTTISRAEFFSLMRGVDEPIKQTYIDADGGYAFFFSLSAQMADFAVELKCDKDAEDQRRRRSRQCVYKDTAKCDGWRTRDEHGCLGCDTCRWDHTLRTVSLNQTIDEGGTEMGDLLAAATDIEREMEASAERDFLAAALASLSEGDRSFILSRFQDGMTLRKLAGKCGISDFRYAGKKANRIIEKLKAEAQRLDPK